MNKMKIHVFNTKAEVDDIVSKHIIKLVKENKKAVLGLATGSSPIGIYEQLIKDHQANHTDYSQIKTINLDEYVGLPKDHFESYHTFMNRNLFSHININKSNINLPDGNNPDLEQACKLYDDVLANNIPDLQILGLGSNGHIGFNEPGTKFDSTTNIVTLQENTRQDNARFFNSIDEVPTESITMGIKSIMAAKRIILVAFGKNKADAVYQMVKGLVTEDLPASILQNHLNVEIYLDQDAASKIL